MSGYDWWLQEPYQDNRGVCERCEDVLPMDMLKILDDDKKLYCEYCLERKLEEASDDEEE